MTEFREYIKNTSHLGEQYYNHKDRPALMNLQHFLAYSLEHGLSGKQADIIITSIAGNCLKPDVPILAVEATSINNLTTMLKDADNAHLFIDGGTFYFNALYHHTTKFPSPRIYFIKILYLNEIANIINTLQKIGIQLPIINGEIFSALIEEKLYLERYHTWLHSREKRSTLFKNLAQGRKANTLLNNSILLDTDGCLLCENKQFLMCTSTFTIDKSAIMVGLKLCENHYAESIDSKTFLTYLANKLEIPTPFYLTSLKPLSHAETIAMSLECIQENLECIIEKVTDNTITVLRKTGFRIIFRQEAPDNYAYCIQNPNGKIVARIDSANHHKVNYGPDHVHRHLNKKFKNKVEASYTYGIAMIDIKAIKKLVEETESKSD